MKKAIEYNSYVTDVVKVKNTKHSVNETIMTSLFKTRHLARNRGFSMASVFRVSLAELGGANYLYKIEPMFIMANGMNRGRVRPNDGQERSRSAALPC